MNYYGACTIYRHDSRFKVLHFEGLQHIAHTSVLAIKAVRLLNVNGWCFVSEPVFQSWSHEYLLISWVLPKKHKTSHIFHSYDE